MRLQTTDYRLKTGRREDERGERVRVSEWDGIVQLTQLDVLVGGWRQGRVSEGKGNCRIVCGVGALPRSANEEVALAEQGSYGRGEGE